MAPALEPRVVRAGNRGPFTLDGTRTFLIGTGQVAVVDPGPDAEDHVRAVVTSLASAREVRLLLTHAHRDHSGAAPSLSRRLNAPILGSAALGRSHLAGLPVLPLKEGDEVPTDHGALRVVEVPGHTKDHLAFHWVERRALFVGDLVLGRGGTTWVGEYSGSVGDYLDSLDKVEALDLRVIFPAHGPPLTEPRRALERFRAHRLARIAQVQAARTRRPGSGLDELLEEVYGAEVPPRLREAARASIESILYYLEEGKDP